MITEFRAIPELLGSSGSLGNLGVLGELEVAEDGNRSRSRFNLDDVEFFNLFYESKSIDIILVIEYTGKSTFFRDIYVFIDRVRDIARIKGDKLLR